jgi:DNA modification methylase
VNKVIFGDCRDTMRELAAQGVRVQCCVTSPPYYGLRDYGHPGQIGLEKTPAEYVAALVEVFEGVRELLADDGVLWLNLGDSYASDTKWGGSASGKHVQAILGNSGIGRSRHTTGLPGKNLIGIRWRVAFALQAAGWYLRQDVIWHKPNPVPESVTDRCTKAHEYLFLLTKSERYYWDAEAMKEPATGQLPGNVSHKHTAEYEDSGDEKRRTKAGLVAYAQRQRRKQNSTNDSAVPGAGPHNGLHRAGSEREPALRNRRSVWTVPTQPYGGAHFATFPPALIEPCILAGSRPGDLVLDPFMGSGTTAQVAQALGRQWIGCELQSDYAHLVEQRTAQQGFNYA